MSHGQSDGFDAMFDAAPLGIVAIDQAGRIVRTNTALERMFGYEPGALVGQPLEVLLPERLRERHQAQRLGFMGAPHARPMGQGLDLLGLRSDGQTVPIEVSLTHIILDGQRIGVGFVADVSTRKQLEAERAQHLEHERAARAAAEASARRQALLARAGQLLTSTLDHHDALRRVAQLIVPELCDVCAIYLADGDELRLAALVGGATPGAERRSNPPAPGVARDVADRLRGSQTVQIDDLAMLDPAERAALPGWAERGVRALLVVPLSVRGGTIGALALGHATGRRFAADDRDVAGGLAVPMAQSVNAAQLFQAAAHAAQQRAAALAQLHTIVHSAPIGIGFFDTDLRFQLINTHLARINGLPSTAHLGQSIERILPGMAERLAPILRDVLARGEPRIDLEVRGDIAPDRQDQQYLVSYYPVRSSGQTIGVGAIVQDVTARRQAAEALRRSEQRFRAIFDDAPLGMVLASLDRRILATNPAFQQMLGYSADELRELGPQHFIHPDDLDAWFETRAAIVAGERGRTTVVHRYIRRDGATIDVSVTASLVQDGDGEHFLLVVVEDVTARLRAEEARARLAAIIDSTDDAIIGASLDDVIFAWNAGAERLYGYSAAEMIGVTRTLIVPEDRRAELAQINAAIAGGAPVAHLETVRLHKSGRPVEVMLTLSPIRDAAGSLIGISAIAHDIGERKRLERELREERELLARRVSERTADLSLANAELARAARLKDEFLANMSHELRTPLNSILGRAEALQEEIYGPVAPDQIQALRGIEESGRHLLSLINDILDLSKIEAGRLELAIETVDVGLLCHASTRMVTQMAITKRVSVTSTVDAQVETLDADERRLKQILVNLLSNAVKFTPAGGRVGLDVQGDLDAMTATFSVWDTGIGIAADQLPRLFKPFVQLDSSLSREYVGSGLGLALVLRLTEAHGGSLAVESTPGVGSRFSVTLPWVSSAARPPVAQTDQTDQPVAAPELRRALVVEDSTTAAGHVARYLREFGARVEIIERGAEAIGRAAQLRPDLIILDILLPDMSGWEVLRQLKADPRTARLPVVVVSVVDDPPRARELGAEAFLLKPISRGVLAQTIQQAVRRQAQPEAPQDAPLDRRARILLAEDNQANIDVLLDFLRARGYEIAVARSGHEAIAQMHEAPADLVLMDIQMPGMDGLEAIRHLRADEATRRVPIIALTALAMPGDRERCIEAGADAYLAKPVNLRGLAATIEEQLERAAGA